MIESTDEDALQGCCLIESRPDGWTDEDAEQADEQGWGIFEANDSEERAATIVNGKPYGYRRYELQRMDDCDVFTGDDQAWAFVAKRAKEGDALANRALEFLEAHSLPEYEAITEHIEASE